MSESGDYIITAEKHMDKVIAGVDEVARGTFIGPVIAACVVLPKSFPDDTYKQIKDSKKLSRKKARVFGFVYQGYLHNIWSRRSI